MTHLKAVVKVIDAILKLLDDKECDDEKHQPTNQCITKDMSSKLPLPPALKGSKTFGHLSRLNMAGSMIPYGGTYIRNYLDPTKYQWCKDTFILKENDIFLASYPKCGHHWLQKICIEIIKANHDGIYTPDLYKTSDIGFNTCAFIEFFATKLTEKQFAERINLTDNIYPRLYFSHHSYNNLPIKAFHPNAKIITICRDPKDTIISGWKYFNRIFYNMELEQDMKVTECTVSDYISYFVRGIMARGSYFDYYQSYWKLLKQNPGHKLLWLYYEDILNDPLSNIKKIAQFIYDGNGLNCNERYCLSISNEGYQNILRNISFDNMKQASIDNPQTIELDGGLLFRKGVKDDWKEYLTEKERELIEETMYFKWAEHCSDIKYYQDIMSKFDSKCNKGYFNF